MKMWEKVKKIEEMDLRKVTKRADTNKLPEHDRNKFAYVRLPIKEPKNACYSATNAMIVILKRYEKIFGVKYTCVQRGHSDLKNKYQGAEIQIRIFPKDTPDEIMERMGF